VLSNHSAVVNRSDQVGYPRGRPWPVRINFRRVLRSGWPRTGGSTGSRQGPEATPAESGARTDHAPLPWSLAAQAAQTTAIGDAPHSPWLICGGSAPPCAGPRPEEPAMQEAVEAADCTVDVLAAVSYAAAVGTGQQPAATPPIRLCGWRSQPAPPRFNA